MRNRELPSKLDQVAVFISEADLVKSRKKLANIAIDSARYINDGEDPLLIISRRFGRKTVDKIDLNDHAEETSVKSLSPSGLSELDDVLGTEITSIITPEVRKRLYGKLGDKPLLLNGAYVAWLAEMDEDSFMDEFLVIQHDRKQQRNALDYPRTSPPDSIAV